MTTLPRIILPWARTSELSANARLHWAKRARLVKAQRHTADALAREAGLHKLTIPAGRITVTLTYCPPSTVGRVDDDNVVTACKGYRDAIAAVLRIDDSRFEMRPVEGGRCKDGAIIWDMKIEGETGP